MVTLTLENSDALLFAIDEDPLFKQLDVTLLRVIPEHQLEQAVRELAQTLYSPFTDNKE